MRAANCRGQMFGISDWKFSVFMIKLRQEKATNKKRRYRYVHYLLTNARYSSSYTVVIHSIKVKKRTVIYNDHLPNQVYDICTPVHVLNGVRQFAAKYF